MSNENENRIGNRAVKGALHGVVRAIARGNLNPAEVLKSAFKGSLSYSIGSLAGQYVDDRVEIDGIGEIIGVAAGVLATEVWTSKSNNSNKLMSPPNSSGRIETLWFEHNVYKNGDYGLQIHCEFIVDGCRAVRCDLVAYFKYADGRNVKPLKNGISNNENYVVISDTFTPPYDTTKYDDFCIFIPYNELNLARGKHNLIFCVRLYNSRTKTYLCQSSCQDFSVTQR